MKGRKRLGLNGYSGMRRNASIHLTNVLSGHLECLWIENLSSELNSCVGFSNGNVVIGGVRATLCKLRLLMVDPFFNAVPSSRFMSMARRRSDDIGWIIYF
jgi:hypothetical protein